MATKREPIYQKKPGHIVGVIAVQAKDHTPGDFNPLVLNWTVDKYRKTEDYNRVVDQTKNKPRFNSYSSSLLNSMFKNWG